MPIKPYDTESKSRNADFILIAREGDTTTLGPKGRCPLSEATQPFYTTRGASRAPFFIICGASRHHHPLNLLNPLNPLNPRPRSGRPPFEPSASLSYNMYKSMDEALFSCKKILIFLPY